MFSYTEVIVTQIVMTQYCCIIITVSNQSTTNLPKLTNLPKFMIKFQKQKLFKDVIGKAISAFAQNNCSIQSLRNGRPH